MSCYYQVTVSPGTLVNLLEPFDATHRIGAKLKKPVPNEKLSFPGFLTVKSASPGDDVFCINGKRMDYIQFEDIQMVLRGPPVLARRETFCNGHAMEYKYEVIFHRNSEPTVYFSSSSSPTGVHEEIMSPVPVSVVKIVDMNADAEVSFSDSIVSSSSIGNKSFLSKGLTIDNLSFDYVLQCNSPAKLQHLINALAETPRKYPALQRIAKKRLEAFTPTSNASSSSRRTSIDSLQYSPESPFGLCHVDSFTDLSGSTIYLTPASNISTESKNRVSTGKTDSSIRHVLKPFSLINEIPFEDMDGDTSFISKVPSVGNDSFSVEKSATYHCVNVNKVEDEVIYLRKNVHRLTHELKIATEAVDEMMAQNDELAEVVEVLEKSEQQKTDSLHTAEAQITSLNTKLKIFKTISNAFDLSQHELVEEKKRRKDLENQVRAVNQEKSKLERLVSKLQKENRKKDKCNKQSVEKIDSEPFIISNESGNNDTSNKLKVHQMRKLKFRRYKSLSPIRRERSKENDMAPASVFYKHKCQERKSESRPLIKTSTSKVCEGNASVPTNSILLYKEQSVVRKNSKSPTYNKSNKAQLKKWNDLHRKKCEKVNDGAVSIDKNELTVPSPTQRKPLEMQNSNKARSELKKTPVFNEKKKRMLQKYVQNRLRVTQQ